MACSWGNNHGHFHNLKILKSESSLTNLLYCRPISLLNLCYKLVDVATVVNVATDDSLVEKLKFGHDINADFFKLKFGSDMEHRVWSRF